MNSLETMMAHTVAELNAQCVDSPRLEQEIRNNLKGLGYEW
jgi:hypothetical protein